MLFSLRFGAVTLAGLCYLGLGCGAFAQVQPAEPNIPAAGPTGGGASAPAAAMSATKMPSRSEGVSFAQGGLYSTIELRHHLNTYYDQEGYLSRREPSVHARLQFGAQLYAGLVDFYTTLGAYKIPETQQVMQRRPELSLDFYPVRSTYFTLLQYNLLQLPFRRPEGLQERPETESTEEEKAADAVDGTVYTIGVVPTVKLPIAMGSSMMELRTGADAWTKLYSRRQYTGEYQREDDEDDSRLGVVDTSATEGEPIEDYAMHYQTQYLAGIAFKAGFLPGFSTEATVNSNSRFDPQYKRNEDGAVEYKYTADRYSYYRWRMEYELSPRVSLVNDFYHFHEGFFEGERKGEERRFRNIARLTCRM